MLQDKMVVLTESIFSSFSGDIAVHCPSVIRSMVQIYIIVLMCYISAIYLQRQSEPEVEGIVGIINILKSSHDDGSK